MLLGPGANALLIPNLHVSLHALHSDLQILTSKFIPELAPLCQHQNLTKFRPPKVNIKIQMQ
jgi:hypothetical protein